MKAGKLLLHEISDCLISGTSFGLESTLSGTTHVKLLGRARTLGYQIEIHYLWIPSPVLALRRIAQRVKKGGHHVPEADVRRRFDRSSANFLELYSLLADRWAFWNNTIHPASLLFSSDHSTLREVKQFIEK